MKTFLILTSLVISSLTFGAVNQLPNNTTNIGRKSSALEKALVFENNLGASNTAITSTPSLNDLKLKSLKVKIGTNAVSSSPELQFSVGTVSAPAIKYDNVTSKFQFSNDGSTFQDVGSGQVPLLNIVSVSGSYTVAAGVDVVLASGTSTITLPDASISTGRSILLKNASIRPTNQGASNTITIIQTVSSQLIDSVSGSTSLVNFGETVDLVSNGTGWIYKDNNARVRRFGGRYGGTTQFLQCATTICPMYENTGAISGTLRPAQGNYNVDVLPFTCRSIPVCNVNVSNNGNQMTTSLVNTASSTSFPFTTAVPGVGVDNTWGSVNCQCTRW